jgi:hypothetical protein
MQNHILGTSKKMNRDTVVMILALFLTMKTATGQGPPEGMNHSFATILTLLLEF